VNPATGALIWKTWIDYKKFHDLAAQNAQDPSFTFAVEDYTAKTPEWALFGAAEAVFDPTDTRHRKKRSTLSILSLMNEVYQLTTTTTKS
jgi:hypothetical protein